MIMKTPVSWFLALMVAMVLAGFSPPLVVLVALLVIGGHDDRFSHLRRRLSCQANG